MNKDDIETWSWDMREAYEERAAIMEYDGGLPREMAEELAKLEIWELRNEK